MSNTNELEDFEAFLEESFSVIQFCNELLKATNPNVGASELDLKTPIKKITYDLSEVEKRIDTVVKSNLSHILDQVDKRGLARDKVGTTLKPSLEYLNMSYNRLNTEVLQPYEHALKLQSALSKVHQTSSILRDVLVFIHLVTQIDTLALEKSENTTQSCVRLASLYSQIQLNLDENSNLKSLQLVKKYEAEIIRDKRQELLRYISNSLIKECLNNYKITNNLEGIQNLMMALFTLSFKDYVSTIDKILLSKITSTNQVLARTITSIRNFPMAMDDAVKNGESVFILEGILEKTKTENSHLLKEYLSQKRYQSLRDIFWTKVSNNFQKDFEISFNRGGPVGKSLLNNENMIKKVIKEYMPKSSNSEVYKSDYDTMMMSISILEKQKM